MHKTNKNGNLVPVLQMAIDYVIVVGVFVGLIYLQDCVEYIDRLGTAIIALSIAAFVVSPGAFFTHRRRMMRAEKLIGRALLGSLGLTLLFAALLSFFTFTPGHFGFFAEYFGVLAGMLIISWLVELVILKSFRRKGRNLRNVIIYGTGSRARTLVGRLVKDDGYGFRIRGFFDKHCDEGFDGKYLGDINDMERYCREHNVDEIYYAASTEADRQVARVVKIADDNFCRLYIVPLMSPALQMQFYMMTLNATIPAIGVHPSPLANGFNRAVKRLFDIVFSGTFLLFSPIIFIPVAIAVKCSSPGPIFFKQKRTGYRGKEFYCYKFRSMKVNKEADTAQATKDDDRKTRVGDFLRRTSIDELPQFFNVLKGDMSVVGPRPHMLAHTEEYSRLIDQYMVRHIVKPGITGWAQVQGYRGATDQLWQMERRVNNDVWYIEHWSFLLDMKIIVQTVTNALHGEENAY